MAERGTGSKIMSFTAKRARRVQEKVSLLSVTCQSMKLTNLEAACTVYSIECCIAREREGAMDLGLTWCVTFLGLLPIFSWYMNLLQLQV